MATTILIKRGLEANRTGVTPQEGELLFTTDNKELWLGDGSTAGGISVTASVNNTLTNDYYDKTDSDNRFVNVAGDTMTGDLILNANPTAALGAATKQYVDGLVDTTMKSPDGFATTAGGDYPSDYKSSGSVVEGDTFYVTDVANGTSVGAETVNVGDLLVALVDSPGNTDANWTIVESNRDVATETVKGVVELATQAEVDAGTDTTRVVTPATLAAATSLNTEAVQDIVGGMVSSNTENGIAVTYDDTNGKLDFDVNDPTITIDGASSGSATMTNLSNVTITTSISSIKNIDDVYTSMAPTDGQVLSWDNTNSRWDAVDMSTGVTAFTGLTDTPANYTGSGGKLVAVNTAEDALEFVDTVDGGTF